MKSLVLFIKTGVYFLWQYLVGTVRWGLHKKNWKTIRMYLEMAQKLSKFAKREKIARNVGWLAEKFDQITKNYSDEDTTKAANEISSSKGILEDLSIGYSTTTKKVHGNVGALEAIYDPSNGDVRFGLKI